MIADDIATYNGCCVRLPGLLRVELSEQAHERLRRMRGDRRLGKVAFVAGDNALGVSLASRLNDYGVFKVGQGAVDGPLQSRAVHRRHFKDRKQGGNVPPGVRPAHGLLRQVEDRGERVGARQSLNLAPVGSREKVGGRTDTPKDRGRDLPSLCHVPPHPPVTDEIRPGPCPSPNGSRGTDGGQCREFARSPQCEARSDENPVDRVGCPIDARPGRQPRRRRRPPTSNLRAACTCDREDGRAPLSQAGTSNDSHLNSAFRIAPTLLYFCH